MSSSETLSFSANGKLLLFGEYVVMRGVPALAFPTRFGQSLSIQSSPSWSWKSFQNDDEWFSLQFDNQLNILHTSNVDLAQKLLTILKDVFSEKPELLHQPLQFEAHIDFDRNWGFGTSATLISLLAQWSGVDPFRLNEKHFGGSSYDIATATAKTPILYHKPSRLVREVELCQDVTKHLLFVYSGSKQNSISEVVRFSDIQIPQYILDTLRDIVENVVSCTAIETFEHYLQQHEDVLSRILSLKTIKSQLFDDYPFAIKSLGAWGGDFFLATTRDVAEAKAYFLKKGYSVCFAYSELTVEISES
jgi:mevalonate kinase